MEWWRKVIRIGGTIPEKLLVAAGVAKICPAAGKHYQINRHESKIKMLARPPLCAALLLSAVVCIHANAQIGPSLVPRRQPAGADAMPTGPYALWPESARKRFFGRTVFRCRLASLMAFGEYHGSKEAAEKEMSAMTAQCVDRQMPLDWPHHASARAIAQRDFAAARALDPSLPASLPEPK